MDNLEGFKLVLQDYLTSINRAIDNFVIDDKIPHEPCLTNSLEWVVKLLIDFSQNNEDRRELFLISYDIRIVSQKSQLLYIEKLLEHDSEKSEIESLKGVLKQIRKDIYSIIKKLKLTI